MRRPPSGHPRRIPVSGLNGNPRGPTGATPWSTLPSAKTAGASGAWPRAIIAIGQFALGLVTVAQFGVGLLFGFGQFLIGGAVLAQFAGGLVLGVGQVATGYVAIGQVVLAYYGLGQIGWGNFLWTMSRQDGEAVRFFLSWWDYLKQFLMGLSAHL